MQIESIPAKLTLTLRMLDKRDDGYNNLEALTVFLPEISDSLETGSTQESRLIVGNVDGTQSEIQSDDSNLVMRAFDIFLRCVHAKGCDVDFSEIGFYLLKGIPHAAGLGGGSADAAATLRILNKVSGDVFSKEELSSIAEEIGSDVPGCVYSKAIWMRGRGERVDMLDSREVESLYKLSALVVTPDIECPTPAVYRRYEELGRPVDEGIESPSILANITPTLHNDLALGAYDLFEDLTSFKENFDRTLGQLSVLAGSGSTFFIVDESDKVECLYNKVRDDSQFDHVRLCAVSTII